MYVCRPMYVCMFFMMCIFCMCCPHGVINDNNNNKYSQVTDDELQVDSLVNSWSRCCLWSINCETWPARITCCMCVWRGCRVISHAFANGDNTGFWEECCRQVAMCEGVYGCASARHAFSWCMLRLTVICSCIQQIPFESRLCSKIHWNWNNSLLHFY